MGENYNNITKSFYKLEENVVNIIDIHSLEKIIKKVNVKENTTNYTNLFPSDEDSICILQKRRKRNCRNSQNESRHSGLWKRPIYNIQTFEPHLLHIFAVCQRAYQP